MAQSLGFLAQGFSCGKHLISARRYGTVRILTKALMHMRKTTRAALYLRVSTDSQTTENQRQALEAVAAQRGWTVVSIYKDAGISGAKGRDQRPGFDSMLKDASRARFDVVMAWALDRLGRSLVGLLDTLHELETAHVDLFLLQQAIDTTTPAGRMFFHVTGAFAEFERGMIRQRVNAGLDRARAKGVRLGRPKVTSKKDKAVREALAAGTSIGKTAAMVGVGSGTVQRIRREMALA
jgi:DNA invertase Pin-like site-specific DNA recombinase